MSKGYHGRHRAEEQSFPAGGRRGRPHADDGWTVTRESSEPTGEALPKGVEGHRTGNRKDRS